MNVSIVSIKQALLDSIPGLEAQLKMAPKPRPGTVPFFKVGDSCKTAGVLLLLFPVEDEIHLVLTRRTDSMNNHQGQISFPGGRQENGESIQQTALREAEEELGIHIDSEEILGELTPLVIPPSQYCIHPVLAYSQQYLDFHPAPEEVAEVLEVPLSHLLDSKNLRKENWIIREEEVLVPFFAFKGHAIWGATAMVLSEFLEIINKESVK
jgi:8-oxo-dGTP pyrophosphatase MutT (NUDIX family)